MSNQQEQQSASNSVKELIVAVGNQLAKSDKRLTALLQGSGISPQKFRYQALMQLTKKPDLIQYVRNDSNAFVAAVLECAEQGLDMSRPNEAHLVPIKGKLVLFRGYKGLAKMARRSPDVDDVDMVEVRKGDVFEITKGSDRKLIHRPKSDRTGDVTHFYAIAYLKSGPPTFEVMTVAEIEAHAKRFVNAQKGPFAEVKNKGRQAANFIPYGLKTVLTRLCYRKLDLSSPVAAAIERDFQAEQDGEGLFGADDDAPLDIPGDVVGEGEPEPTPPVDDAAEAQRKLEAKREQLKSEPGKPSVWDHVVQGGQFAGARLADVRHDLESIKADKGLTTGDAEAVLAALEESAAKK